MPGGRTGLRLHLDAEAELQTSVDFYRDRGGEELAEGFKRELAEVFTAIQDDPERFASVRELEGVQRARLKRFPFSILYLIRSSR
ncbi:MAG: type II toxin-antitoxin system RelE/ParE family toxin [Limisphaerales bacterium]